METWVGELTDLNLLAVYDVALDLKDAAQLSTPPIIPILPTVVRFRALMPANGIMMRDQYAELRWNAAKFLEKRGIVRKAEVLNDPYSHRWQQRLRCDLDQATLASAVEALAAEHQRRFPRPAASPPAPEVTAVAILRGLLLRFHSVATLLRSRHDGRSTLDVSDEYDVQDLLRALLTLHFDDVRSEEAIPSYAGRGSRADFLLKRERIIVEVKKTRSGLGDRELGDQLVLDTAHYARHPDAKTLVCFVYDPENRIVNPGGLQADLSGLKDGLVVEVVIAPTRD